MPIINTTLPSTLINCPVSPDKIVFYEDFENSNWRKMGFKDGGMTRFQISSRRSRSGSKSLIMCQAANSVQDCHFTFSAPLGKYHFEVWFCFSRDILTDGNAWVAHSLEFFDGTNFYEFQTKYDISTGNIIINPDGVNKTVKTITKLRPYNDSTILQQSEIWHRCVVEADMINKTFLNVGYGENFVDASQLVGLSPITTAQASSPSNVIRLELHGNSTSQPRLAINTGAIYHDDMLCYKI